MVTHGLTDCLSTCLPVCRRRRLYCICIVARSRHVTFLSHCDLEDFFSVWLSSLIPLRFIILIRMKLLRKLRKKQKFSPTLLRPGSNLGLSTLRALLADDALGLALAGGSVLGLVALLGGGTGLLLLLALLNGGGSGGGPRLRSHRSLLLDHIEGGADDGSLRLDGSAGSLLGNFLRDTLAVLSSEKNGPGDATGVLALEEKRLGLAVLESEDLAVASDVEFTLARVNSLARESVVVRDRKSVV